jgi:hypothetical protein
MRSIPAAAFLCFCPPSPMSALFNYLRLSPRLRLGATSIPGTGTP